MKPQKEKPKEDNLKGEFRDQFKKKRSTQQAAKERRKLIRDLNEDKDWN